MADEKINKENSLSNSLRSQENIQEISDREPLLAHPKHKEFTWVFLFSMTSCVIGSSFVFGYGCGVVNEPKQLIQEFINKTQRDRNGKGFDEGTNTLIFSLFVAISNIGGMIGGFTAGYLADRFGRKRSLLLNNIITIAASVLLLISKPIKVFETLIVGNFLLGLSSGYASALAPLYLTEIAPIKLRGASGSFQQFAVVFGSLVSNVFGLTQVMGKEELWPYLLGFCIIPALIQLISLPFCPESPTWLYISQCDEDEARDALKRLHGHRNVDRGLSLLEAEKELVINEPKISIPDLFRTKHLRQPTFISVIILMVLPLSGFPAVTFYSTSIFKKAGLQENDARYCTVGMGGIMVIITLISTVVVDRVGRRPLMLLGIGLAWIFSIVISIAFIIDKDSQYNMLFAVVGVLGFVMAICIGPGSIPWLIVPELFTQGARASAVGLATLINWIFTFAVAFVYLPIQEKIEEYSWIPFNILLVLFFLFLYFKMPETKGKSIEEITLTFRQSEHEDNGNLQLSDSKH